MRLTTTFEQLLLYIDQAVLKWRKVLYRGRYAQQWNLSELEAENCPVPIENIFFIANRNWYFLVLLVLRRYVVFL